MGRGRDGARGAIMGGGGAGGAGGWGGGLKWRVLKKVGTSVLTRIQMPSDGVRNASCTCYHIATTSTWKCTVGCIGEEKSR